MGGVQGAQRRLGKLQMSVIHGAGSHLGKPASSPEAVTVVELVLGNDDLLREVLLRLTLPTSLVRAACVSKRWLRVASSPAFLRDFRILHPPLLGSFPSNPTWRPKLLPCRRLPDELTAMALRANGYLSRISRREPGKYQILDIRSGRMLFYVTDISDPGRLGTMICTPLQPAPPAYLPFDWLGNHCSDDEEVEELKCFEFLPEDGGDGLSYFEVRVVRHHRRRPNVVLATVVSCQAGILGECQATPPIMLPKGLHRPCFSFSKRGLLCHGKFYMLSKDGYILGLDLLAMTLFYICLPEEMQQDREATDYDYLKNIGLSCGEGSKFYLVCIKGLKVFVWLHDAERGRNANNWALVDTICLLQVFVPPIAKHDLGSGGCSLYLHERCGDNAEFVYLSILDTADDKRTDYLLHIKSRAVEKVLEEDGHTISLLDPFTLVWPPAFPALDEEDDNGHVHVAFS